MVRAQVARRLLTVSVDYDRVTDGWVAQNSDDYRKVCVLFEKYDASAISMCANEGSDTSLLAMMPFLYRKWKREKK